MCPKGMGPAASMASLNDAISNHAHRAPLGAQFALTPRAMSLAQAQRRRAAQERKEQQAQPQPGALAQQEQRASA